MHNVDTIIFIRTYRSSD